MLIPWPNRLQDGSYEFDGRRHQLPLTEPEHSNAIHGLVRWVGLAGARARAAPRRARARPSSTARLSVLARARRSSTSCRRAVSPSGRLRRTSGTRRCPYGSGAHPYLTLGAETIDDVVLRVPARTVLRSDDRGIPVGTVAVDGTELDFRSARRDRRDEARQRLHRPRARRRGPSPASTVEVGRQGPDALGRRGLSVRHGLHGRHPLRATSRTRGRADDLSSERVPQRRALVTLEPGESHTASWGLSPTIEVRE